MAELSGYGSIAQGPGPAATRCVCAARGVSTATACRGAVGAVGAVGGTLTLSFGAGAEAC